MTQNGGDSSTPDACAQLSHSRGPTAYEATKLVDSKKNAAGHGHEPIVGVISVHRTIINPCQDISST